MSSTRSVKSPGVWAADATTTIPGSPLSGVAYRRTSVVTADARGGWPFDTLVDSAEFNELLYRYTSLTDIMDRQGVLGWSDQVDYAVPAIVFGSDGVLYKSLGTSGPTTTARDPISNPAYWSPIGASFASNRNRIINGNFRVNQRAYVSGAATSGPNQYTLDRWRVVTSGQNLAFSVSGNGYQVTAPAGGIEQVIEGTNIEGGPYVLSWSGTATATINGSAATNGAAVTLTAGSNVTVKFSSGTVSLVQLEPGTAATAFEHRPIDVDLAACQRYYEAGSVAADVYGQSGAASLMRVGFLVAKRATPTITQVATATGPLAGASLNVADISVGGFSSGRTGWASTGQSTYTNTWTASSEL